MLENRVSCKARKAVGLGGILEAKTGDIEGVFELDKIIHQRENIAALFCIRDNDVLEAVMTFSEIFILVQTIILLLTGLAVVWYTRETYLMRKETAYQNTIMARQLEILEMQRSASIEKESQLLEPMFSWPGGKWSGDRIEHSFKNNGMTISNIRLELPEEVSGKIYPTDIIKTDQEGYIEFKIIKQPKSDGIYFKIHYQNKLGEHKLQTFGCNVKERRITAQ